MKATDDEDMQVARTLDQDVESRKVCTTMTPMEMKALLAALNNIEKQLAAINQTLDLIRQNQK